MRNGRFPARKVATVAALTALSLVAFLIENLFPPMFIPGAKLGIANAFSFVALILYSPAEAFIVVGVRTVLGAVFAGNFSAVMYSFTGGMVSMTVSSILLYLVYPKMSLVAISVAAAVFHNITQNVVFVLLYSTPLALFYMPYLILIGAASGAAVGAAINLIFKKVPESVFVRAIDEREKDGKLTAVDDEGSDCGGEDK